MKQVRMLMIMAAAVITMSLGSKAFAAGPAIGNFDVTASVAKVCRIASAPDLIFGVYDPVNTHDALGVDLEASTTVTIRCTKNTNYEMYITPIAASRVMTGAPTPDSLNYALYADSNRTIAFPSATGGSVTGTATSPSLDINIDVYGTIPKGQDIAEGTYTQQVTVTVDYL